jgi:hypothetical protein
MQTRHTYVGMVFHKVRMVTIGEKVPEPYTVAALPEDDA